MSRDKKIEKINSYQKLLASGRLPTEKDGDSVSAEINREFRGWVESQLANLLGEGGAGRQSQFTDDEVVILKTLVARASKKASQPQEQKKASTAVLKDKPRDAGKPMPRPNVGGKDILSALEEMDLMGARYLED